MGVDLDRMTMSPVTDGWGSHGGYCGPAVKPIALNMVAEIARDAATAGLPISGIGGISTWRDAAEFIAMGCGTVQVCTAAMVYGFKIVQDMCSGLSNFMDEKGYANLKAFQGMAVPTVTRPFGRRKTASGTSTSTKRSVSDATSACRSARSLAPSRCARSKLVRLMPAPDGSSTAPTPTGRRIRTTR